MTSLFLSAREIMEHRNVSYKTACKIFKSIVVKFKLPKERELSVKSYCEHYNLREEQVYRELEALKIKKRKESA
jgi:hypothetical protein